MRKLVDEEAKLENELMARLRT